MKKPIVAFDLLSCNTPDREKTQPLCVYMFLEPWWGEEGWGVGVLPLTCKHTDVLEASVKAICRPKQEQQAIYCNH